MNVDEFETADTSGELTRDSKPENTKDNEQETKSEKGQVKAINEELVVDDNAPVDEINKVKDSVPIDLKAKLTKEEENAHDDERQTFSSPGGDMADSDRLTSGVILSLTNLDIGERPVIRLPFSFLICKYAIDLPSLTLHQMCWSRAEALGEVIDLAKVVTTSHVMGENMEMETVQKRSIHPGHHILGHHTAPLHQVLHLVDQNTH